MPDCCCGAGGLTTPPGPNCWCCCGGVNPSTTSDPRGSSMQNCGLGIGLWRRILIYPEWSCSPCWKKVFFHSQQIAMWTIVQVCHFLLCDLAMILKLAIGLWLFFVDLAKNKRLDSARDSAWIWRWIRRRIRSRILHRMFHRIFPGSPCFCQASSHANSKMNCLKGRYGWIPCRSSIIDNRWSMWPQSLLS